MRWDSIIHYLIIIMECVKVRWGYFIEHNFLKSIFLCVYWMKMFIPFELLGKLWGKLRGKLLVILKLYFMNSFQIWFLCTAKSWRLANEKNVRNAHIACSKSYVQLHSRLHCDTDMSTDPPAIPRKL